MERVRCSSRSSRFSIALQIITSIGFCFCVHKSSACQEKQTAFRCRTNQSLPCVKEDSLPPDSTEKTGGYQPPVFSFVSVKPALSQVRFVGVFLCLFVPTWYRIFHIIVPCKNLFGLISHCCNFTISKR